MVEHLKGVAGPDASLQMAGFKQDLESRGSTSKHVAVTLRRIESLLEACSFSFWKDLMQPGAAAQVQLHLGKRRAKGEISGKSFNYFVRDLRTFCKWMFDTDRAPVVAMQKLKGVKNADMDSEKRRALTSDEMRVLLPMVENSGVAHGMDGAERAVLCRFAFETGLRPNQIANLVVADFDLTESRGTVTSAAKHVKRRQSQTQLLTIAMTLLLRDRFSTKLPNAHAFAFPRRFRPAEMLRADLALARAAWIAAATTDEEKVERGKTDFLADINHQKESAVFYSLRHGHGTALAEAGVPEKDIAASMHHSSRKVTERYIHATRKSLAIAIESLPDLSVPEPLALTGTDAKSAARNRGRSQSRTRSVQIRCIPVHSGASKQGTGNGSEDAVESGHSEVSQENRKKASWRNWQTQWIQNKRRPFKIPRKTKRI